VPLGRPLPAQRHTAAAALVTDGKRRPGKGFVAIATGRECTGSPMTLVMAEA
jgi:hypothetical protein